MCLQNFKKYAVPIGQDQLKFQCFLIIGVPTAFNKVRPLHFNMEFLTILLQKYMSTFRSKPTYSNTTTNSLPRSYIVVNRLYTIAKITTTFTNSKIIVKKYKMLHHD
eukprot:GHVU01202057.1.p2 GENE.GHVU01202057.1~~GHVU01202057.1.p2  ORF type:complete len:107 (+),score=4.71 GHVU01202057.1:1925-2245(+)